MNNCCSFRLCLFICVFSIFLVLDSELKLLIGAGIKHLKIIEPSHVDFSSLLNQNTDTTGTDETEKIRDSLIKWFTERHIQVFSEKTNLIVLDEVTIHPPYLPENCLSHNEIMLSRIKKLLKTFYEK
jgi:Gemin6 protein/Anticodon-binding domain